MADFVLTQTDAQVQSVLNDAQDAQGAGAQTTLTTEYVMLKDTEGRYHKILKSSLTEACRNVLAGLLVNNDKGTTISQIAAIASGDFGSVTPANLASVLGGTFMVIDIAENSNVDNIKKSGIYVSATSSITSTLSGTLPTGFTYGFYLEVIGKNPYIQTLTNFNGDTVYRRGFVNNAWSAWKKVTIS